MRLPVVSSEPGRRVAVVGSPVSHSLSPVLHKAAFDALGLHGWSCDRIERGESELAGLVAGLGPEWAGLAVTMPGKKAALALADEVTPRATAVGAANTLVPLPGGGWRADCTDVAGVTGALLGAGRFTPRDGARGVLVGAGGTALAALAGLTELGVDTVTVVARDPARAADVVDCADRIGSRIEVRTWSTVDFAELSAAADVVISTVPAGAADPIADQLAMAPCVLDVIYHPWPTVLAKAVANTGHHLATGLDMLLHQAFPQSEQFTGHPAPRQAMRDALHAAVDPAPPLPL